MSMHANSNSDGRDKEESYAEGTALTVLLGDGPKVKILSAFLAEPDFDLTVTEVAEMADVSRNTVYRHLEDLQEIGVVIETRKSGRSRRFAINKDNPAAKKLAELEWELMDVVFEE